jgi:hypothetical protein
MSVESKNIIISETALSDKWKKNFLVTGNVKY